MPYEAVRDLAEGYDRSADDLFHPKWWMIKPIRVWKFNRWAAKYAHTTRTDKCPACGQYSYFEVRLYDNDPPAFSCGSCGYPVPAQADMDRWINAWQTQKSNPLPEAQGEPVEE